MRIGRRPPRLPRPLPRSLSAALAVLYAVTFALTVVVLFRAPTDARARAVPARPPAAATVKTQRAPSKTVVPVREPLSQKVVPPPTGSVYWGAFRPGAPSHIQPLRRLSALLGRTPAIDMWFQDMQGGPHFPAARARSLADRGIVPMLTWEPRTDGPGSTITLRDLAGGRYDRYLRRFARQIRAYGGPLLFRPMHEMNGFWYPWSGTFRGNTPADYVKAWRHIHRVFDRVGARQVTWVWCVNHLSLPDTPENSIAGYWPGRAFVDWVGISGFNRGLTLSDTVWSPFDWVMREAYLDVVRYGRPVMIAETAAPEIGGDKAAWIRDMFEALASRYARVGAVVWFDARDRDHPRLGDWRINSSHRATAAFRRAIARPGVLSAPAAMLAALPEERRPRRL